LEKLTKVDVAETNFEISRDLAVAVVRSKPGPPKRIDGMSVGIVSMDRDPPHGGEMHPDGDEILYVISGKIRITCDSEPDDPIELSAGEASVVPKGEWHKINVIEAVQLIHITPGPNGDARPK